MKGLSLITKGKNTCSALTDQLNNLLGDKVRIKSYYIDGNIKHHITDDLIVVSSRDIFDEAVKYINTSCPAIIAHRSINYHQIHKLIDIPPNTDVLFVNDLASTVYDTIDSLKALGIDHINYFPYYPGAKEYPKLKIAVTPGEGQLVPDFVDEVVDIRCRNIDLTSIIKILQALEFSEETARLISAKYIRDIIEQMKKTKVMMDANTYINNKLHTIINTVHDGIIALDGDTVTVFNPAAEEMFDYPGEEIIGKNIKDKSIRSDILSVLESRNLEEERFVKVNDKRVVVNSSYIKKGNSSAEVVYTLKDVTEIQRLEAELRRKLISQENYARYTFEDIVGNSQLINNVKNLARKVAVSDSPVLIYGESGVGKELFAHAIHNASRRKNYPFVAVNFAALPESLIESELFGYEEGAFTGARKGGMPGLFEQAHRGTIFLDEIGDAPIYFQIRLLRVLQEKRIRRVGGSKVIPIDVRVICATNKDLKELIGKGQFRQDLYYRLNVLPLRVPPLRHRKEDIMILAERFYNEHSKKRSGISARDFFQHVRKWFLSYNWPGNIRELENVVEYLVSVSGNSPPGCSLLPEEMPAVHGESLEGMSPEDRAIAAEVLRQVRKANCVGEPVGRRSLSRKINLPEGRLRRLVDHLRERGLLSVKRGIKGLEITEKGIAVLDGLNF